jgi:hypothetical protein
MGFEKTVFKKRPEKRQQQGLKENKRLDQLPGLEEKQTTKEQQGCR